MLSRPSCNSNSARHLQRHHFLAIVVANWPHSYYIQRSFYTQRMLQHLHTSKCGAIPQGLMMSCDITPCMLYAAVTLIRLLLCTLYLQQFQPLAAVVFLPLNTPLMPYCMRMISAAATPPSSPPKWILHQRPSTAH